MLLNSLSYWNRVTSNHSSKILKNKNPFWKVLLSNFRQLNGYILGQGRSCLHASTHVRTWWHKCLLNKSTTLSIVHLLLITCNVVDSNFNLSWRVENIPQLSVFKSFQKWLLTRAHLTKTSTTHTRRVFLTAVNYESYRGSGLSTHSAVVGDYSWLELVGGARVNDDAICRLNSDGLGDVIMLFIVPSDRVSAVIRNVLNSAVAQQTQEQQLTGVLHILDLKTKQRWVEVIDELNKLACSSCMGLHNSAGRALQRERRGHGFESRWSPENLFLGLLRDWLNCDYNSDGWPRSNEWNLRKTRKTPQRKGCPFFCSKFDTLPVSCSFTNFFLNFTKKVLSIWKWSNSDLLTPFVKAILSGCGAFKSKETRLCERNGNTFTLNSYYKYPCLCFHFTVNEMSRNKTKSCPRRLTAVDSDGHIFIKDECISTGLPTSGYWVVDCVLKFSFFWIYSRWYSTQNSNFSRKIIISKVTGFRIFNHPSFI